MFLGGFFYFLSLQGDPFVSCGTQFGEVAGSKEKSDVSSPVLLCISTYFNIPIFKIILIKKF